MLERYDWEQIDDKQAFFTYRSMEPLLGTSRLKSLKAGTNPLLHRTVRVGPPSKLDPPVTTKRQEYISVP